jgi:hypothetical protein
VLYLAVLVLAGLCSVEEKSGPVRLVFEVELGFSLDSKEI